MPTTLTALTSLFAHATNIIDVLPAVHQHAVDAMGGICSLLLEQNPRTGALQATSGYGLDTLPVDPLETASDERSLINETFRTRTAILVSEADRQTPELALRLGTRAALLIPLIRGEDRVGLLAIGFDDPDPSSARTDSSEVADAFLTALELFRLRENEALHAEVRNLLAAFSENLTATLNLASALDVFCGGANRLFGADRTSVWLHDRRARHLVLRASSDPEHLSRGARVSTDDMLSPAANAMRHPRAGLAPTPGDAATFTMTFPLRGTRRALGTIVFDGVRVDHGREIALLDRADELGRQLSSSVENMNLLDEVLRSRRELENAFDSIADLVVVSDRRGRIVHANRAFATRVAASPQDLLDRPLADYIGPELQQWLANHETADRPREGGEEPTTRDVTDPVLKGHFLATITDLVNQDRERQGSVIVARDLTPQTRLEAEREELRRRLTQSEKLAALGQFVAGIAHELNNPLQAVLGYLELLRTTGAFPKKVRRDVQIIYREADRSAKIVRNLLVFAGSRPLVRKRVSLNAVLQKVVALRAPACRAAGIEVVRNYDDRLPRVVSDPLLLHQAFLNIVMNAEQAVSAAGGGRIVISTSLGPRRDRIVASVRDTGAGIPADALPRIFEPFYTTKEVGKGTGLGLAIAYGIVQEHGGQIVASNHPDGGALFTVELPAAPA